MDGIDKRNRLEENPFSYKISKDNTVFIEFHGKRVKILKGKEVEKFLKRIELAGNDKEVQLILAKITGNFKRGNERKK
ncbi:hypothetical protein MKY29_13810 [Psychrobacillus sp. FSL K6-2365]|jgi:hypothetical protein|uniref:hypothetical protein n=1 Tax=Psychrobacillus TaxID=1221880 RepID=UPI0008E4F328|nr:hypothetical protein [Psychrobacillus psychrodurans]MCZ8542007.1 hypothetical protein [Psychrobacillus psychrodurans]SFN00600.1 hypothetical protein SAMN05421832_11143 [Psychrobacillus psychrodurans]